MLQGLTALVTGASSGIGAGIARMLAGEGVRVTLVARRRELLTRVAETITSDGGQARVAACDITDADAAIAVVDEHVDAWGAVDILVNSAGSANSWARIHEMDLTAWRAELDVNLTAPMVLCRAVLPPMRGTGRGFIVNIASEAGVRFYPGTGGYGVSKHAMRALTELIQAENQSHGIKAWAVCPGWVDTDMSAALGDGDRSRFLAVDDVVAVVRELLLQPENVKMGPEVLIRTMRNPFDGKP